MSTEDDIKLTREAMSEARERAKRDPVFAQWLLDSIDDQPFDAKELKTPIEIYETWSQGVLSN